MPNDNNEKNKFPNSGNFSASQNNYGKTTNLNNTKNNFNKNIFGNSKANSLANKITNSKKGNNLLDKATKPLASLGILGGADELDNEIDSDLENVENTTDNSSEEAQGDNLVPKFITDKVKVAVGFGTFGCLGSILIILIVAAVILSPTIFIHGLITNTLNKWGEFWDQVLGFFKGCNGKAECQAKDMEEYTDKLLEVRDEYIKKYNITLNTELITATLTYYDPMETLKDINSAENLTEALTDVTDFKKSKKHISDLAEHQKATGKYCIDSLGNNLAQFKEEEIDTPCPEPTIDYYYATPLDESRDIKTKNTVHTEPWYYLDIEKYREYLLGTGRYEASESFVRRYFYKGRNNEEVNKQIPKVVEDIFNRVEVIAYLSGSKNRGNNFISNNAQVVILDNSGNPIEEVSLFEYIQGVLYNEGGLSNPDEYLKAMAVVVKNYLFARNNATVGQIPDKLRIRSSTYDQVYCSVSKGCHVLSDGTHASGPDASGNYKPYFGPITDVAQLERLNAIINETLSEYIIDPVNDTKFLTTQYKTNCTITVCAATNDMDQSKAIAMANAGSNYHEILNYFYNGVIDTISFSGGLPLDAGVFTITSEYGGRDLTSQGISGNFHHGLDFGVSEGHNVYAVADGVVVTARFTGDNSWGCFVKIGHDTNGDGGYEFYTGYAHLLPVGGQCNFFVTEGQSVSIGTVIALSGGLTYPRGSSTGAHLHFEYYLGGSSPSDRKNPRELLTSLN